LIAVVTSCAAFWILYRLLAIFPDIEGLRIISAFIMVFAVNGMHNTGMTAATFIHHDSPTDHSNSLSSLYATFGAVFAAGILLLVSLLICIADLRK
jgi:NO-binding membrane sensor protein with MHYT domain